MGEVEKTEEADKTEEVEKTEEADKKTNDDDEKDDESEKTEDSEKVTKKTGKKRKGIFEMVEFDFPSDTPDGKKELPQKNKDLLTVKRNDLVYHFGDIDHNNGWVWATIAQGPNKGKTGWLPKWALKDKNRVTGAMMISE